MLHLLDLDEKSSVFCRGSGGFVVQERGSLALTNIALDASARVSVTGGTLSLASMAVPATVLGAAEGTLSDAGSTLRLDAVTVPDYPTSGPITGVVTVGDDGLSKIVEPASMFSDYPNMFVDGHGWISGVFAVTSGPCAVSESGRCVGRPEGYGPNEHCAITVGGGGGVLGPCPVFDTDDGYDYVTLPGTSELTLGRHGGSNCPEGVALPPGDAITWTSDGSDQGSVCCSHCTCLDNGCAAKGTCGLPRIAKNHGLGGGWELCFA